MSRSESAHPLQNKGRQRHRVFIDSANWACRPNLMTTARLMRFLRRNGHTIARRPGNSDLIVINSCGFIQDLEDRSLTLYRKYKRDHPHASVVFAGCLSRLGNIPKEVDGPVLADIEDISSLLGTHDTFKDIGVYLDDATFADISSSSVDMRFAPANPRLLDMTLKYVVPFFERSPRNHRLLASMKAEGFFLASERENSAVEIARGCVFNCNYCIIKKARGGLRSRAIEAVLADVQHLSLEAKEVRLVADDCGSYGQDIGTDLIHLVQEIHRQNPGLAVSINYLNPYWLERDLTRYMELFAQAFITSINISMQSCSQSLMEAMNRHYSVENVLKAVERIKNVSPRTVVFSHFIVGHPGETWRDFIRTLRGTRRFDFISIFRYSPRPGTVSASMQPQIGKRTVAFRYHLLLNAMRLRILLRLISRQWIREDGT